MFQLLFPLFHVVEPLFGCLESEGFAQRGEGEVVCEGCISLGSNSVDEVVCHGLLFLYIFVGDAYGQTHCFQFAADGVVGAGRPVGAPASDQSLVVRVVLGVLHIDDTGTEGLVGKRFLGTTPLHARRGVRHKECSGWSW